MGQPWGSNHPDKRSVLDADMRVTWTADEVNYVRKWIRSNPCSPVRKLYDDVHCSALARQIFHGHHVDIDKLSYIFKKLKD